MGHAVAVCVRDGRGRQRVSAGRCPRCYMCVCMYICMCVCVCIYIYIYEDICICSRYARSLCTTLPSFFFFVQVFAGGCSRCVCVCARARTRACVLAASARSKIFPQFFFYEYLRVAALGVLGASAPRQDSSSLQLAGKMVGDSILAA